MNSKSKTTIGDDEAKVIPSYVYTDLENEEQSILEEDFRPSDSFNIRVIDLEPAEALDAPLRCKIEFINVSRDWDFDAVSYVWGPPLFSHTLVCIDVAADHKTPDTRIAITPTLDRVLRRFRKTKEKRRLWADAACINQKNAKEKSQQVQRMAQIYRAARSVLVWLGDAEEMDKCIDFFWGLSSSRHENSTTTATADESIREELVRFFGHTEIDAVQRFLSLPWFTRRWVVQEALPTDAHFFCGALDITAHALHHAIFLLKKSSFDLDQEILDHIQNLEWQAEAFKHPDQVEGSGILDLLVQFNRLSSTDDLDRIYAYLGLANDIKSPFASLVPENRPRSLDLNGLMIDSQTPHVFTGKRIPIQIDYGDDATHVYAAFAEQMLRHKDHLEILHSAGAFRSHATSISNQEQSWVPNWKLPMRHKPFISVPWFEAGLSARQTQKPFLNYPWCLVEGFVFSTVDACVPLPSGKQDTNPKSRREMPPIGKLCSIIGMPRRYVTGERMWQALALTFIADHGADHKMKRFYSQNGRLVNGKLVKRNASERDMHTLLDWWARFDEADTGILDELGPMIENSESTKASIGALAILDAANCDGQIAGYPSADQSTGPRVRPDVALLLKQHGKSRHQHNSTGMFFKPSHTAKEWGPTSYEKQSGWHSRVDEELEPYMRAEMNRLAHKTVVADGAAIKTSEDSPDGDDHPENNPYDCEWRYQNGTLVWFDPHDRNEEKYIELAQQTLQGRSFFITAKGYIGIGPDDMEKGDVVVILYGARTPFVLRQTQDQAAWSLLGDCYVHGIMAGEAQKMKRASDRKFKIR